MSTFTGFKDYPDNSTPLSAEFLNAMLDLMYPIGKVEVFFDDLDHSDYMGFTWERTAIGKMPIGYDPNDNDFNIIGNIGGTKTHNLTTSEIPSHNHMGKIGSRNYNAGVTLPVNRAYARSFVPDSSDDYGKWKFTGNNTVGNAQVVDTTETGNTGGGQAFSIMNPHQVFAFWKRVEAS